MLEPKRLLLLSNNSTERVQINYHMKGKKNQLQLYKPNSSLIFHEDKFQPHLGPLSPHGAGSGLAHLPSSGLARLPSRSPSFCRLTGSIFSLVHRVSPEPPVQLDRPAPPVCLYGIHFFTSLTRKHQNPPLYPILTSITLCSFQGPQGPKGTKGSTVSSLVTSVCPKPSPCGEYGELGIKVSPSPHLGARRTERGCRHDWATWSPCKSCAGSSFITFGFHIEFSSISWTNKESDESVN